MPTSDKNPPPNKSQNTESQPSGNQSVVWQLIKDFFYNLTELRSGLDKEGTIVNIKNNKRMAGANAWLLMCSIMIASLGLDLNSPAVIIGAMLISPLMSPILGIGLAVGINDRKTLGISLRHFGMAIAIALVTSTLYFWLTPFGNETPEIRARTAPTLLDVAVAFFGGIAGIISGSRKDKSNAIPGVAIATALMPPLCVTGYGIANSNWVFMLNSFYLFFMNATFVALATLLIVRFLDFPITKATNERENSRTRWIILIFSLLMIAPSLYIFSGLIRKSRQERIIHQYINNKFPTVIYKLERIENSDSLDVNIFLGEYLPPDSIQAINRECLAKGAFNVKLNFLQDSESWKAIDQLRSTEAKYLQMVEQSQEQTQGKNREIEQLNARIDSLTSDNLLFSNICNEVKVLFPNLQAISLASGALVADLSENEQTTLPVLYLEWPAKMNTRSKREQEKILVDYVKVRARLDTLKVTH